MAALRGVNFARSAKVAQSKARRSSCPTVGPRPPAPLDRPRAVRPSRALKPHISAASAMLSRSGYRCGRAMRQIFVIGLAALLLSAWFGTSAQAQGAGGLRIEWEVKHRFRLFRSEADFQRHVAAFRGDGVLGAERRLAISSDGRG